MVKKGLHNNDLQTLQKQLLENRKELNSLLMNHAVEPLKNPAIIGKIRKTIAKILTIINHKKAN